MDSAILPGYIYVEIHSNHIGMTKFASEDDLGFIAAVGELRRWMKELSTIAQAAAFISTRKPRMTFARYLVFLRDNEKILLEDMRDLRRDPDVPNSVIMTWHISFNQIKKDHPRSADLFSLMSVLDRQGLPDDLFSKGETNLDFENDVARLIEFSLLVSSLDGRTSGMHRLVQIAMKYWLDLHDETRKWQGSALCLLHRSFPYCRGPEDWKDVNYWPAQHFLRSRCRHAHYVAQLIIQISHTFP